MKVVNKYIYINVFSLVKRLFVYYPNIYSSIKFIPVLIIYNRYISKSGLLNIFILSSILFISGNKDIVYYFLPFFCFILFKNQFRKVSFDTLISKTKFLLVLSIIYGLIQYIFGYLPFEMKWLMSDLSIVNDENLISNRNIRPFSIFASIPEFTLFCSIYVIYFFYNKNYIWLFISLIGFYISGTRGLIISTFLSYIVVYSFSNYNNVKTINFTLFLSLLIYFVIYLLSPILSIISDSYSSNRYLLYGSFTGRVENLLFRIQDFDISNLLIPMSQTFLTDSHITLDNMHINLILCFGILGYILFLKIFKDISKDFLTHAYFSLFISYGFYNDIIFSFYSLILYFVCLYAKKR